MRLQNTQNQIRDFMSLFVTTVKANSAMGLQDLNKIAENIMIPIFRQTHSLSHLENLNFSEGGNFPAVDLGDKVAGVAIQITATTDAEKIKHTLRKFIEHGLYKEYGRLVIYILTEKKSYSGKGFEDIIQGNFTFDKEKDIWDYQEVLAKVAGLEIGNAVVVEKILEENFTQSKFSVNGSRENVIYISNFDFDQEDFVRWLAYKLISEGYSVWCTSLNLKGGDESTHQIQSIINDKAALFLYVVSARSNIDPNALQELQQAYDVMRRDQLDGFITPLMLDSIDLSINFLLRGFKPVVFYEGWAKGLNELLFKLEKCRFPKDPSSSPTAANIIWRQQFQPEKGVIDDAEDYLSNWFPITLPETVYFHELQRSGIGPIEIRTNLPYPGFQHNINLVTFAEADDFHGSLGTYLSIKTSNPISTTDFLNKDYDYKLANSDLAWNFVTRLVQEAWERFMHQKRLGVYQLANNKNVYYFHRGFSEKRISFNGVDGKSTNRGLSGYKTIKTSNGDKVKKYWLFGISGKTILYPFYAYIIKPHVVFSDDGYQIWKSKSKLHKARRSWCKDWWNDDWRDRVLASFSWLSGSQSSFQVPVSSTSSIVVECQPAMFTSPVTYNSPGSKNISTEEDNNELEELPEDDSIIEDDEFSDTEDKIDD